MKQLWKILGVLALVLAACAATFVITYTELTRSSADITAKTGEISQYLDRYFIDDYDQQTLMQGAADGAAAGMIQATGDKWSYYLSAEQYAQHVQASSNDYVGIGITIKPKDDVDGFVVVSVQDKGPAAAGGVQVGDILQKVEGASALEIGQEETVNRARGEVGTQITLTFLRDGKPYDVTLTRADVPNIVASYTLGDDKKAVITIKNFDAHCSEQAIAAIEQAIADGAVGIVFDLRSNPGGMKDELVPLLDRILPEGALFRSVDYADEEEVDESDAIFVDLPMAVLINQDSYSAAEFFAAAMQEYEAATIVGVQTSGKGNFQNVFALSDGSAIGISIGKYFTPNGVSLTDVGVTPDVEVKLTSDQYLQFYYHALAAQDDPQLQAALDVLP